ncbi:MAG: peptidylprolyl isomerase [Caldilineaceae bacterium]|nr:peptidylprolyl isomerase [Caldilineaceae bacterium]
MAKKRRRRRQEEQPQVENRREVRLRARDRERNLRLTAIVGGLVGVALLLVLYGVANELIIKPNSVLAQVEDQTIVTRDFWQQARLRESELQNQRLRLQIFAQQFGDSSLFASQIASINATLASPLTLGTQVLNDMIEAAVLQIKAPEVGVSVTDDEVEETLRQEVAQGQGALTVPQATATADAAVEATATAESFTPTPVPSPTPTPEDSSDSAPTAVAAAADTETLEEAPTPEPPTVLTDALYQEGLSTLEDNLRENAGMNLASYREVIRARLLRTKMSETVSRDLVSDTEEQVRVRHILISVDPEPEPAGETEGATPAAETTPAPPGSTEADAESTVAPAAEITVEVGGEDEKSPAETPPPAPESRDENGESPEAPAAEMTAGEGAEDDGVGSPPAPEIWNPDANGDGRVDDAEALAFAQILHQRILDGEDFADLALRFSNDPGSGSQGGDLGWAGRGRYVPEFEETAFSLGVGEMSAPVKSTFGYHIIEVLERDDERPKEEASLQQEYAAAFQTWLQEQVLSLNIDRPDNLAAMLPRNLGDSDDQ